MVKVLKIIIARKPENLRKLKHNTGIIIGRNIRKVENKGGKNDKTS